MATSGISQLLYEPDEWGPGERLRSDALIGSRGRALLTGWVVDQLRKELAADALALVILQGLTAGLDRRTMQHRWQITDTAYNSARRAIRRKVQKLRAKLQQPKQAAP